MFSASCKEGKNIPKWCTVQIAVAGAAWIFIRWVLVSMSTPIERRYYGKRFLFISHMY